MSEPPSRPDADLIRFLDAQDEIYDRVIEELTTGRKHSHWMWFIFPQVAGLGRSSTTERYAIWDLDQARRYLADPILGARLREMVRLVMEHKGKSAFEILGSPDDLKFRSCLTLFREAASEFREVASEFREVASENSDRVLFTKALDQFYRGQLDSRTLELVRAKLPGSQ
jgi:uncharacterized protein (DUF1810 family)